MILLNPYDPALHVPEQADGIYEICRRAGCVPLTAMHGTYPVCQNDLQAAAGLANALKVPLTLRVSAPNGIRIDDDFGWRTWIDLLAASLSTVRNRVERLPIPSVAAILLDCECFRVSRDGLATVSCRMNELAAVLWREVPRSDIVAYRFGENVPYYSTSGLAGAARQRPFECFNIVSLAAYFKTSRNMARFDGLCGNEKLAGLRRAVWIPSCCGMGVPDESTGMELDLEHPDLYVERARTDGQWCAEEIDRCRMHHIVAWTCPYYVSRPNRANSEARDAELKVRLQCWEAFCDAAGM